MEQKRNRRQRIRNPSSCAFRGIFLFEAVKDGNIEAVSKNLKEEAFTNPEGMGILSKNPLTNLKYHFVVTVALVTRYCIDGGMETEQAYRLSDFYIIHMDACSTIQEISDLHHEMALDFTGKMRLLQKNAALSKPVAQCIDYIYAHISARITVEDLAVYTNLSASYLSRLFKQNLGVSISDYIREKKSKSAESSALFRFYLHSDCKLFIIFFPESFYPDIPALCRYDPKTIPQFQVQKHMVKFCYPRTIRSVWFSFPSSTANGMQMPVFVSPAYR